MDLTGQRFGRLAVVKSQPGRDRAGAKLWLCVCDCEITVVLPTSRLTSGTTRSCGCLVRDTNSRLGKARIIHGGMAGGRPTPEFTAWMNAKARCYNPKDVRYYTYGAIGITMCDRWRRSFGDFYADMGPRPSPLHSLDRLDVHGPYAPGNCRWATREEQMRNRHNTVLLTWRGETKCQADWAAIVGLTPGRIQYRLSRGWSVDRTLTTPGQTSPALHGS